MKPVWMELYEQGRLYIPDTLGELYDQIAPMLGDAPSMADAFEPYHNLDSRFFQLTEGLAKVRGKLGEERYAATIELAARAKALFAEAKDKDDEKTDQGLDPLLEIEDIIQATRKRRSETKQPDDEGRVTGD